MEYWRENSKITTEWEDVSSPCEVVEEASPITTELKKVATLMVELVETSVII